MQQGWLYQNGQIHKPSGAFDYIDGTIDNSSTWKSFDVVAAGDGVAVWDDDPSSGYGVMVLIRHDQTDDQGNHFFTLYAHLKVGTVNSAIPKLGRFNTQYQKWVRVFAGEILGQSDATGSLDCTVRAQCIHLHFEVRLGAYRGTPLDPYDISKSGGTGFKRNHYPGGSNFIQCGPGYLWTVCPPSGPSSSVIARATLDGNPWPTPGSPGAVSYNIVGPNGVIIGSAVPGQTSGLVPGQYIFIYNSGGPTNSTLSSVSPSTAQTLTTGGSITFTLQFESNSSASFQFLSFVQGNPGIPGDGIFVSSLTGGVIPGDFKLSSPFPLRGVTDGITTSVFPDTQNFQNVAFTIVSANSTGPCALLQFGAGAGLTTGRTTFNGVQGNFTNSPQSFVQSWVDFANLVSPGCNFTVDDFVISDIYLFDRTSTLITTVDAISIGRGQNVFPGTRAP